MHITIFFKTYKPIYLSTPCTLHAHCFTTIPISHSFSLCMGLFVPIYISTPHTHFINTHQMHFLHPWPCTWPHSNLYTPHIHHARLMLALSIFKYLLDQFFSPPCVIHSINGIHTFHLTTFPDLHAHGYPSPFISSSFHTHPTH